MLTENGQILAQDVDEIGKLAMGFSQFMQIQAINLNLKTVSAGKLPFPIISFRTHSRTSTITISIISMVNTFL